jgi:cell division protease FtsH
MQENQNTPKNDEKGGPKFNYYWIYAIVALLLIGLNFFWPSATVKSIDYNRLEKIIKAKDLEKIVIINKEKDSSQWHFHQQMYSQESKRSLKK